MELEQLKIEREPQGSRTRRARRPGWVMPLILLTGLVVVGWLFRGRIKDAVDGWTLPAVKVAPCAAVP